MVPFRGEYLLDGGNEGVSRVVPRDDGGEAGVLRTVARFGSLAVGAQSDQGRPREAPTQDVHDPLRIRCQEDN